MTKASLGAIALLSTGIFLGSCNNNADSTTGMDSSATAGDSGSAAIVPPVMATNDSATTSPDQQLVYDLTESMYAGIALMKEGQKKATDPAVKALANKLVTEHSKLTTELETLAGKKGWKLPAGEPAADMTKREAMIQEDAKSFQKDWLAALRERHETNLGKLKSAQPADADVKAAGEKGAPVISMLLEEIKQVQGKLNS